MGTGAAAGAVKGGDEMPRLSVRIINKGRTGKDGLPHREMRVFVRRPDGSLDRVGTLSLSWGRCSMIRQVIESGCTELGISCEITEPVRAQEGLG